jgi:hypothetical protein
MCDPTGVHITRIYVNCPRETPSPIRSQSNTVPVCTSTPIINIGSSNSSPKKQMALLAKEILASQRSSETFIQKCDSPRSEQYVIRSKETGQPIDLTSRESVGKMLDTNTGTVTKKKKKRQSLAVVPPLLSTRMFFKNKTKVNYKILFFRFIKIQ